MKLFDLDIASIHASHNPDNDGITVSVSPGESYSSFTGNYAILRGRYGYKTTPFDESVYVLHESSDPIEELSILDDSVEPGILYYYSIVFELDIDGVFVWAHNPNKHLASSFGNKYMSYRESIYNLLPRVYIDTDSSENLKKMIAVYSYPLEIARTEIDIRLINNNIFYVPEDNLPALASIIGWRVNRELDIETQRFEILKASETYQSKGRHFAITNLIEFVTGWNVTIEEGHFRVFELGDCLVNQDDTYQLTHVDSPWMVFDESFISDLSPSQVLDLTHTHVDRVSVEIDGEYWLEVDDLSLYGEENVYTTNDSGMVFFGDGINGNIPESTIYVTYVYEGDTLTYTPDPFKDWKHDTGFRLLLEQQEGSVPFNDVFVNKVARIVDLFKSSYASYVIYIVGSFSDARDEVVPTPIDEYTLTENTYGWFILDESPMDSETHWMV